MVHEIRKVSQDVIDKAIDASIHENQELLDRLQREEMIFAKKMNQMTGWSAYESDVFELEYDAPNFNLGEIPANSGALPFSLNLYSGYIIARNNVQASQIIGE